MASRVTNIGLQNRTLKGAYTYPDGSEYKGYWNTKGQRHGFGILTLNDNTRYIGGFENGLSHGFGVMLFNDRSKYEGNKYSEIFQQSSIFEFCFFFKASFPVESLVNSECLLDAME
jgi:hypothetical protein